MSAAAQSSLIMALFRIVEPCGGRVTMDGVDTSTVGLDDLRQSRIAIIPQDPAIFSGSIRYNLEYVPRGWSCTHGCASR